MPAFARAALRLAETPYAEAMQLRNAMYERGVFRSHKLGRPCISVGNLTAGGTGKTPVVLWLAKRFLDEGCRPAVLMRGYRKRGASISDEQKMLQALAPDLQVHANPDRVAAAAAAVAAEPSITHFILDDGLQHRRVRRDFDLVLVNARRPFGFGHVHPRGLLRENMSGLDRADAVLLTHASEIATEAPAELERQLRELTDAPVYRCDHVADELISADSGTTLPLERLQTDPFVLFTGLGDPDSLESRLRTMAGFRDAERFGDHHHYTDADLRQLLRLAGHSGAAMLVTTEKDWAKVSSIWAGEVPLYRIGLRLSFADKHEAALLTLIRDTLAFRHHAK